MVYADYEYYTEQYLGNKISEADFPKYARWASKMIDRLTFDRTSKLAEEEIPDGVRDAVCSAAECNFDWVAEKSRGVKSESNDGYSVTYTDVEGDAQAFNDILSNVRMYLLPTGLLYRGRSKKYGEC